jgi:death-on-curing protein
VWVLDSVVLAIHKRQIAEHGGAEGLADEGLLASALARPKNLFAYKKANDLADLAAAYAFGIATNHSFVDGNKRTAFVVARTFLCLNGHDLEASQEEKYLTFLQVADGTIKEQELANWIREHMVRTE